VQELIGQHSPRPLITNTSRVAFHSSHFRVEEAHVSSTLTGLETSEPRIASANPAQCHAIVVPVLADGRLIFWVRYRFAPAKWSVEFPRIVGSGAEDGWRGPVEKQLRGDAGLSCPKTRLLGAINSDPMFVSTSTIVICGDSCQSGEPPHAPADPLVAGTIAVSQQCADELIRRGTIECGLTLAALMLYRMDCADKDSAA